MFCSTSTSAVAINNIADGSERKCNRMTQQLNIRIKTEEENLPLDLIVVDTRMQSMANCEPFRLLHAATKRSPLP